MILDLLLINVLLSFVLFSPCPEFWKVKFLRILIMLSRILKGRSFPGKILITRRSNSLNESTLHSPSSNMSFSPNDTSYKEEMDGDTEV